MHLPVDPGEAGAPTAAGQGLRCEPGESTGPGPPVPNPSSHGPPASHPVLVDPAESDGSSVPQGCDRVPWAPTGDPRATPGHGRAARPPRRLRRAACTLRLSGPAGAGGQRWAWYKERVDLAA